jgi:Plasmid encoded RepA protein
MTAFIKRIGLATDGRNIKGVKEQLKRLASTSITIGLRGGYDENSLMREKSNIIKGINLWFPKDPNQKVLWKSTVRLSDDYFNTLVKHAVPLDERVIAAIKHNSLALDTYAWLAQRTFRIEAGKTAFIPWVSLWEQFGQGYSEIRMFRRAFRDALRLVQTCHRFNVTEVEGREPTTAAGLSLEFSQSPIISINRNPKVLAAAKKFSEENDQQDSRGQKRLKSRVKNQLKREEIKKNQNL